MDTTGIDAGVKYCLFKYDFGETSMADTFDYVVVGAGSGGCAVASR